MTEKNCCSGERGEKKVEYNSVQRKLISMEKSDMFRLTAEKDSFDRYILDELE